MVQVSPKAHQVIPAIEFIADFRLTLGDLFRWLKSSEIAPV